MSKEISYSDGDIENEIFRAIADAPDVSSNVNIALERQKESWAFEYHLSRDRANIVRHLDFNGKRVLEIGAGMGAISRYVAEQCSFLQVVEGTSRRLGCLKERLRGLSNFDVFCGNFKDFHSNEKFDVVLIIGVLEYAEIYYDVQKGQNPFVEFLKKAKSLLTTDGSIVVAIENRLGIKYWAGATEDHTCNYFDGILGYPTSKSVRTFSKKELMDLFVQAGIESVSVQYPFPDYKLPKSVLTERLENLKPQLFSDIAGASIGRDYSQANRPILFSDSVALESFSSTGLLGHFSNSFLFISGKGAYKSPEGTEKELGFSYSKGRAVDTVTRFTLNGSDIEITKNLQGSDASELNFGDVLWTKPKPCFVTEGTLLSSYFRRIITFREWEVFDSEWNRYLSWVLGNYGHENGFLNGHAWDLIPSNVIKDENDVYVAIDQEWRSRDKMPISWFVLRCLGCFDQGIHSILCERFSSLASFYSHSCKIIGSEQRLELDCLLEVKSQISVYGDHNLMSNDVRIENLLRYLESGNTMRDIRPALRNILLNHEIERGLRSKLEDQAKVISEMQSNHAELYSSYSILLRENQDYKRSRVYIIYSKLKRIISYVRRLFI